MLPSLVVGDYTDAVLLFSRSFTSVVIQNLVIKIPVVGGKLPFPERFRSNTACIPYLRSNATAVTFSGAFTAKVLQNRI